MMTTTSSPLRYAASIFSDHSHLADLMIRDEVNGLPAALHSHRWAVEHELRGVQLFNGSNVVLMKRVTETLIRG
jgi:hypothetical protein